jgi:hypothetical protein
MLELILAAALVWPAECVGFGELYREAARLRDHGLPLAEVLKEVESPRVRLAIIHTYERRDMSAQSWYWLAIGICIGQKDPGAQQVRAR